MTQRTSITPRRSRAFTLIELMIVVVIIGVLSSLAIYSVIKYVRYSKTSEAREVIASINAGQSAFNDEVGRHLDVTGGLTDADFYPASNGFDGTVGVMWGAADACTGEDGEPCIDHFNTLGVVVNKAVLFRYANTLVGAGVAVPDGGRAPTFNPAGVAARGNTHVIQAVSDLSGNGTGLTVLTAYGEFAEIHHNGDVD